MKWKACLALAAVASALFCSAALSAEPSWEQRATVLLSQLEPGNPTMGSRASGTIIHYGDHFYILSTGHQYRGITLQNRDSINLKIGILQKTGEISWVRGRVSYWDHNRDLSLLEFGDQVTVPYMELGWYDRGQACHQWGWNGTENQMFREGLFSGWTNTMSGSPGFRFNRPSIPGDSGSGVLQGGKLVGVVQATDDINRNAPFGNSYCAHSAACWSFLSEASSYLGRKALPVPQGDGPPRFDSPSPSPNAPRDPPRRHLVPPQFQGSPPGYFCPPGG